MDHPTAMIAIYEPLYLSGQTLTEPAFRPLKLESNIHAHWREFRILIDIYKRGLHREQRFTGLFSPKFGLKARIAGSEFMDFVRANADADICFVNPFSYLAYLSYNVWTQGESAHPGLVARAQGLLDATNTDLKIAEVPRHGPDRLCYCNFWVGTEEFWERYVGGILLPIAAFLENNPDSAVSRAAWDTTSYRDAAPFLPFIVERLFSSYLSRMQNEFVFRAYSTDPVESCVHEVQRDMVACMKDEVDAADRAGFFSDALKKKMAAFLRASNEKERAVQEV